jgi:hypothetical protein
MDHEVLDAVKALADPNRLRVAGACAGEAKTVPQLASDLELPAPAVRRHLDRLLAAGLVESAPDDSFILSIAAIHALGRRLAAIEAERAVAGTTRLDGSVLPPDEARIIRGFFRDDRLTTIPSQEKKRFIVVRYLRDRCFTEDRPYPEKEVNQRLALFHPDVATLRRAMVDEGLLTREAGVYRLPTSAA